MLGSHTLTLDGTESFSDVTVTGGNVVFDQPETLSSSGILNIGSGTSAVLGSAAGSNNNGQNADNGTGRLSSGQLSGGGSTPTDVVEFYLQPISYGTTSYTTDFESDANDQISVNSVDTSAQSGTIYLAVYAGLNQADQTHSDDGVQSAELNFTSTGTIGDGSSLGLTPASGFGSGPVASTGALDRSQRRRRPGRGLDEQRQPDRLGDFLPEPGRLRHGQRRCGGRRRPNQHLDRRARVYLQRMPARRIPRPRR